MTRLLTALLAVAGLGGAALPLRPVGAPEPVGATRTHVVEIDGFVYVPAELEVAAGDTVVWINRDLVVHSVTDTLAGHDSGAMAQGERWTWVPSEAGELQYFCTAHPSMRGAVRVTPAR